MNSTPEHAAVMPAIMLANMYSFGYLPKHHLTQAQEMIQEVMDALPYARDLIIETAHIWAIYDDKLTNRTNAHADHR